jgi:enterochelin esterase family protein
VFGVQAPRAMNLRVSNQEDTFAYMAGFSGTMNGLSADALDPATAFNGIFKDGAAFNEKVKLLWIGMGTEEPAFFHGSIGAFRTMLDKAAIKYF